MTFLDFLGGADLSRYRLIIHYPKNDIHGLNEIGRFEILIPVNFSTTQEKKIIWGVQEHTFVNNLLENQKTIEGTENFYYEIFPKHLCIFSIVCLNQFFATLDRPINDFV